MLDYRWHDLVSNGGGDDPPVGDVSKCEGDAWELFFPSA